MNALALAALLIGQCSGPSCPTPSSITYPSLSLPGIHPSLPVAGGSAVIAPTVPTAPASVGWTIERRYRAINGGIVEAGRDDSGKPVWRYVVLPPERPVAPIPKPVLPNPPKLPTKPIGEDKPELAAQFTQAPVAPMRNEGLILAKVFDLPNPSQGQYLSSGPHAQAFTETAQASEEGNGVTLKNDRQKPRVTLLSDNKAALAEAKAKVEKALGDTALVTAYDPSNPLVKDLKFWRGRPEIVFQAPPDPKNHDRGEVVARLDFTATDQQIIGARRLADPSYDPAKDGAANGSVPWLWIMIGSGLALMIFLSSGSAVPISGEQS